MRRLRERRRYPRACIMASMVAGLLVETSMVARPNAPPHEWRLEAFLRPDRGPPPGSLGPAVALGARRAAVGSSRNQDLGTDSGSVHCYDQLRHGWRLGQVIPEPQGSMTSDFGAALAMDGEHLVVGAPRDSTAAFEAGQVHVYSRGGSRWVHEAALLPRIGFAADNFGAAVAVDRHVIAVGVPHSDDGAVDAGSVEVFERRGLAWSRTAVLHAPEAEASCWFGAAVAVEGDLIAVGAFGHRVNGQAAGAAYLFRNVAGAWTLEAVLAPSWPPAWFGYSVAISDGSVIVGAPRTQRPGHARGVATGAAFVFVRSGKGWSRSATLIPEGARAGDGFGVAVALDRDGAFVGASGDDAPEEDCGGVFAFPRFGAGFRPGAKLSLPGLSAGDNVGAALSASRGRLLIGRLGDPEQDPAPGFAYLMVSPMVAAPPPTSVVAP